MIQELRQRYGSLLEEPLIQEIAQVGSYREIPSDYTIINIGEYIRFMPLVISGAIKVLREDEDGNELLLYYLEPGDTCSMTMTCCMGNKKSDIRAIAETDSTLIVIPIRKIEQWMGLYSSWRNFVLNSYHERLEELMKTVDGIAFKQMDQRLIQYLKKRATIGQSPYIQATHQQIAYDLNSSRVVVSRLLKKLEETGAIQLNRNAIEVLEL